MTKEEIQTEVAKINWWHRINLGQGIVTPGLDDTPSKLDCLSLPVDLSGKTVLDIGAWNGFFSFEAERRGAKRVLATDSFIWSGAVPGVGKEGFTLARRVLNSKVEDKFIDVMDLGPEKVGTFDVVFFLGVLYHMRHPLLSLERVSSVIAEGGMVILETHVDMLHLKRPAIAFYPTTELGNDPTNWCGPNPAAVESMLKAVGFKRVEIINKVSTSPSPGYAVFAGHPNWDPETIVGARMVFHAWK
jgi:tRNA (mo5U34)-methyltransferase